MWILLEAAYPASMLVAALLPCKFICIKFKESCDCIPNDAGVVFVFVSLNEFVCCVVWGVTLEFCVALPGRVIVVLLPTTMISAVLFVMFSSHFMVVAGHVFDPILAAKCGNGYPPVNNLVTACECHALFYLNLPDT